jgi:hypothetical protein
MDGRRQARHRLSLVDEIAKTEKKSLHDGVSLQVQIRAKEILEPPSTVLKAARRETQLGSTKLPPVFQIGGQSKDELDATTGARGDCAQGADDDAASEGDAEESRQA